MSKTVLLFEIGAEKRKPLRDLCRSLGINAEEVKAKDYRQKLGYLAHIQGYSRERAVYAGEALSAEMMVFSGLDSDCLDEFLEGYRVRGLSPIGLKAVLTIHNINWTSLELFAALQKEQYMIPVQNI